MANMDTFIGNYRVISQIFSDPFSRVYLAEHSYTTRRPVAIRLWHTVHFNSTQEYSAFLQEAQALVTLSHPYVLSIIDLGVEVDSPYVVTEYIYTSMGSLRDRIRQQSQQPFQQQEAFGILSETAQGLYQAHQQNIIHRQLAPEHIIFNMRGEAILADFGLMSILENPSVKKVNRFDTDPYAAPEQARGVTNRQSDQYALAAIAYELLTGYPPARPPVPPRQINQSLSVNVEQAILKGMAPDESDRHADVGAFMVALFTPEGSAVVAGPGDADRTIMAGPSSGPIAAPITPVPGVNSSVAPVAAGDHTVLAGSGFVPANMNAVSPTPVLPPLDHTMMAGPASAPMSMGSGSPTPLPASLPPVGPSPVPLFEERTLAAQTPSPNPGWSYTGEQPFQPLPAFGVVQGGPSWASANTSANPALGSAYGAPGTTGFPPPGSERPAQAKTNRRRNILIIAAIIVVLLVVIVALLGPYLSSIVPASSATVTLTPMTKSLAQTYTINGVTSTPDATQHQGPLRVVSYTTPAKTGSAKATGQGNAGPTHATGTLVFSQASIASGFAAGTTLPADANGIQVATTQSFTIQPGATVSVPAEAVSTGPGGNVAAFDVNSTFNFTDGNGASGTIFIQNPNAFTGGADSSVFTYVQQSDIDGVANPLEPQMTTDAQSQVQKLVHTDEKLVGQFKCLPNVTSDHKANDKANTVNVSVTVTCRADAYVPAAIGQVAADWLKSDAVTQFGTTYALAGNVLASDPTVMTTNSDGTGTFSVNAKGIWAYQFTDAQEHQFAQSVVGKTQADGKALLLKQEGVKDVSNISTGGFFGSAFPSAADNIKFVEEKVAGAK